MQNFLIRLVITIGVIWLTQFLLDLFGIQAKIRQIILAIVALVMILWLLFGATWFQFS